MILSRRSVALIALASILTLALTTLPQSTPTAGAADKESGGKAVAHKDGGARVALEHTVIGAQLLDFIAGRQGGHCPASRR